MSGFEGLHINHPTGPGPKDDEPRWTTDELREKFEVIGFSAPYVVVRRLADGKNGVMEFVQNPGEQRLYFGFIENDSI